MSRIIVEKKKILKASTGPPLSVLHKPSTMAASNKTTASGWLSDAFSQALDMGKAYISSTPRLGDFILSETVLGPVFGRVAEKCEEFLKIWTGRDGGGETPKRHGIAPSACDFHHN